MGFRARTLHRCCCLLCWAPLVARRPLHMPPRITGALPLTERSRPEPCKRRVHVNSISDPAHVLLPSVLGTVDWEATASRAAQNARRTAFEQNAAARAGLQRLFKARCRKTNRCKAAHDKGEIPSHASNRPHLINHASMDVW